MKLINYEWRRLLNDLLTFGIEVRPRERTTMEILGYQTHVDMSQPLLTEVGRNLGYRFAVAEPAWIASGDNRVETIKPFAKHIHAFSDDGYSYFGAYGPKFVEQLSYVVNCLFHDPSSRQALMTVWRERPGTTKDVPCTVALQWVIRANRLHCLTTMRSNDAWFGWPYDVHTFSVLSMCVLILLRNRIYELRAKRGNGAHNPRSPWDEERGLSIPDLGRLTLTAGSQHIYKSDWDAAREILSTTSTRAFSYRPIDLNAFPGVSDLVDHYWRLAKGEPLLYTWLREINDLGPRAKITNQVQT